MLEVITGPMFSGKTNEFIEKVKRFEEEGKIVVRLKPVQDTRYSRNDIVSHDGLTIKGLAVDEVHEILEIAEEENCDVLAIDEIQFFGWDFIEVANQLADKGVHVLVAGIDLDFTGRPFGIVPELMAYADLVVKKTTTCRVCGDIASRSQRLVNGQPAKEHDPLVLTGGEHITYEPRCRVHHEVRKTTYDF